MLDAIGDRAELVVVAQSFGGFTAPLVCERVSVELLVLVAGLIPSPGEAPRDWWANTGYEQEGREGDDDVIAIFYHDVPPELAAEALNRGARSVGHTDARAVAARGVARCAHTVSALSRRPPVAVRLPAPGGTRALGHRHRRDRRRTLRRPQPPEGTG